MILKLKMALCVVLALSVCPVDASNENYRCLPGPENSGPKLDCSDLEASHAFLSIEDLIRRGRVDDGLALLEMLVKAKPFHTAFRVALVESKLKFSRLEGIADHVNLLNKLDPRSENLRLLTARTLDQLDRKDEAIALLSKQIDTHAGSLDVRRLRAQIYEKNGNWKQAQTDWHILERAKLPTEERLHRLMVSLKDKNFEVVRRELEPLVKPEEASLNLGYADLLAQAYLGLSRYTEAAEWGNRILEKTPEAHEVRVRLAKALIAERKYEEAVLHLTRVIGVQANHLGATYQLARVRILQDRFDLAGQALARLAQLERGSAWTVKAQAGIWNHLGETPLVQSTLAAGSLDPYSIVPAPVQAAGPAEGTPEATRETASEAAPCVEHLVQRGETLEGISQRYFQSRQAWSHILAVNSISDPHRIREGMVLWIPKDRETGKCGE